MTLKERPAPRALVIVGMHRSGTSALTKVLGILGCDLPGKTVAADEFNARGYWESPSIAQFNEEVLQSAGLSWFNWESLSAGWYGSGREAPFRDRIPSLLSESFGDSPLFALKDPRICRLLPLWQAGLGAFGATASYILPVRSPSEVAASLLRRNGTNPSVAQLVWLRYVLDAELQTRSAQRVFLAYADLLGDWRKVADTLASRLELAWPTRGHAQEIEIDAFLSSGLRHHIENTEGAAAAPITSDWVRQVYQVLLRWSAIGEDPAGIAELDGIRAAFDAATRTFIRPIAEHSAYAVKLTDDIAAMAAERTSIAAELGEARASMAELALVNARLADENNSMLHTRNSQLSDRDERIQELLQDLSSSEARATQEATLAAALTLRLSAQESELATVGEQLRRVDTHRKELSQALAASNKDNAELTLTLGERSTLLAEVKRSLQDRNLELADLEAHVVLLTAALDRELQAQKATAQRYGHKIARRDREIERLSSALSTNAAERTALHARQKALTASLERTRTALQASESAMAEITSSTTWRASAPLRIFGSKHVSAVRQLRSLRTAIARLKLFKPSRDEG